MRDGRRACRCPPCPCHRVQLCHVLLTHSGKVVAVVVVAVVVVVVVDVVVVDVVVDVVSSNPKDLRILKS